MVPALVVAAVLTVPAPAARLSAPEAGRLPDLAPAIAATAAPGAALSASAAGPGVSAAAAPVALGAIVDRAAGPGAAQALTGSPEATAPQAFDGVAAQPGWSVDGFSSAADAADIVYKYRLDPARRSRRATVFSGGLGLAGSFETHFDRTASRSNEFFLWLRGTGPTPWRPGREILDHDARDLARMIVTAAVRARARRVDLALHSYGTLLLQRLIQLRGDPEVARALALLQGSRLLLFNATTSFPGASAEVGPQAQLLSAMLDGLMARLDTGATGEAWARLGSLNIMMAPALSAWRAMWSAQKALELSAAARPVAEAIRAGLQDRWPAGLDAARARAVAEVDAHLLRESWWEALVRRSHAAFKLGFTREDAQAAASLGLKLRVIHSAGDQVVPWAAARLLPRLFGLDLPRDPPQPGFAAASQDGALQFEVVAGDHYLPLKEPDQVARRLEGR